MKKKFIDVKAIHALWVAGIMMCAGTCGLSSCSDDYDDSELRGSIENLEDRVASLEEWQKSVNTSIESLQSLVSALENRNYITGVTPITEGGEEVGYTISFQNGEPITIRNGKNGATPVIGVTKDTDGKYYWTLNGEFMTDESGKKIPVTGEAGAAAIAPQVRISSTTNEWEISNDGGKTWTSTGVQATGETGATGSTGPKGEKGDSMFSSVDTSDPNEVTFTLADGTKITVPRVSDLLNIEVTGTDNRFSVTSELLKANTGNVVHVRVESPNADGAYIETRSIADGTRWNITSTTTDNTITILAYPAKGVELDETALLMVTVSDSQGNTLAKGQKAFSNAIEGGTAAAPTTVEELKTAFEDKDVELVTLTEDLSLSSLLTISATEEKTIDLNNQTLDGPKNGSTLLHVKEGTVTFKNGKLDIANPGMVNGALSNTTISVGVDKSQGTGGDKSDQVVSKGEIIFDHVEFNGNVLVSYGSTVKIHNSVVTNDLYCVCTNANASKATTEPVNIEITNTTLTGETPIMLNVPSNVTIDGCTITGGWQGVMLRGGKATISNSTISLQRELATPVEGTGWKADQFVGQQWGSGNNMVVAGITMGNNSSAYQYATSLELKNTKVSGYDGYWAVFADATSVCTVDFKYDSQCVFSPALDAEKSFKAGTGKNNGWITVTDGSGKTTKY